MKITKFGHSCLLVEEGEARILFDPGSYSTVPEGLSNLDVILITHEHQDHVSVDLLKTIINNNPQAKIVTNDGVGAELRRAGIAYEALTDGQSMTLKGVAIEAFGRDHAVIYPGLPHVDNTGYLINKKLYHPGDALFVPPVPVKVLALPVVAPWSKISEVIDYAKAVQPEVAFPIHDGMLKFPSGYHKWPENFLTPARIKWLPLVEGQQIEV